MAIGSGANIGRPRSNVRTPRSGTAAPASSRPSRLTQEDGQRGPRAAARSPTTIVDLRRPSRAIRVGGDQTAPRASTDHEDRLLRPRTPGRGRRRRAKPLGECEQCRLERPRSPPPAPRAATIAVVAGDMPHPNHSRAAAPARTRDRRLTPDASLPAVRAATSASSAAVRAPPTPQAAVQPAHTALAESQQLNRRNHDQHVHGPLHQSIVGAEHAGERAASRGVPRDRARVPPNSSSSPLRCSSVSSGSRALDPAIGAPDDQGREQRGTVVRTPANAGARTPRAPASAPAKSRLPS